MVSSSSAGMMRRISCLDPADERLGVLDAGADGRAEVQAHLPGVDGREEVEFDDRHQRERRRAGTGPQHRAASSPADANVVSSTRP